MDDFVAATTTGPNAERSDILVDKYGRHGDPEKRAVSWQERALFWERTALTLKVELLEREVRVWQRLFWTAVLIVPVALLIGHWAGVLS